MLSPSAGSVPTGKMRPSTPKGTMRCAMAIPVSLVFEGQNKEFQFRDKFVMPLLVRLGFGVVANNHGQREFGRDVIFGDVDRLGHVVYYGMQIKYEASISLSDSHSLIQDAEQATHNPFLHP